MYVKSDLGKLEFGALFLSYKNPFGEKLEAERFHV